MGSKYQEQAKVLVPWIYLVLRGANLMFLFKILYSEKTKKWGLYSAKIGQ